jgi:hypothetical protein
MCVYVYIYIRLKIKPNSVRLLDFRAVKFLFFPRRDLNPHHWYTALSKILYDVTSSSSISSLGIMRYCTVVDNRKDEIQIYILHIHHDLLYVDYLLNDTLLITFFQITLNYIHVQPRIVYEASVHIILFWWRTGPYTAIWPSVPWTICYICMYVCMYIYVCMCVYVYIYIRLKIKPNSVRLLDFRAVKFLFFPRRDIRLSLDWLYEKR